MNINKKLHHNEKNVRLELYAENRGGNLMIKIAKKSLFVIRHVLEVLDNQELLNGFSPADIARIRVIGSLYSR